MDLRTATLMERTKKQAVAVSVFLVVLLLGVSTTFIALSFVNRRPENSTPVLAPEQPVVTASWVMPVEAQAATILKSANFNMLQKNQTTSWYEFDLGYTIGAAAGTKVMACYDGTVTSVVDSGDTTTGNLVRIKHQDGVETVYSSLDQVNVKVGDQVKRGQKIGTVGNTAQYETFQMPHVRLTAFKNGKAINPEQYVDFPNHDDK